MSVDGFEGGFSEERERESGAGSFRWEAWEEEGVVVDRTAPSVRPLPLVDVDNDVDVDVDVDIDAGGASPPIRLRLLLDPEPEPDPDADADPALLLDANDDLPSTSASPPAAASSLVLLDVADTFLNLVPAPARERREALLALQRHRGWGGRMRAQGGAVEHPNPDPSEDPEDPDSGGAASITDTASMLQSLARTLALALAAVRLFTERESGCARRGVRDADADVDTEAADADDADDAARMRTWYRSDADSALRRLLAPEPESEALYDELVERVVDLVVDLDSESTDAEAEVRREDAFEERRERLREDMHLVSAEGASSSSLFVPEGGKRREEKRRGVMSAVEPKWKGKG
ncbi:hypothetical protein H0H92_007388 [Tricholoma furcatifolium]|nr:hypothetical protein H0H92_007388 [Tricholoma furcatifolium]